MYEYTLPWQNSMVLRYWPATDDLYHSEYATDILNIRTFYESQFLAEGLPIHYLKFKLPHETIIEEPPGEDEG